MRTENKWNKKNALRMLIYVVLHVVMSVIVCVLGSIQPIFFVCYQITAGLLVTGVAAKAFDKIRTFGAAFYRVNFTRAVYLCVCGAVFSFNL